MIHVLDARKPIRFEYLEGVFNQPKIYNKYIPAEKAHEKVIKKIKTSSCVSAFGHEDN